MFSTARPVQSTARTVVAVVAATVLLAIGLAVFWWLTLTPAEVSQCEATLPARPGCFREVRQPVAIQWSMILGVLYLGTVALTVANRLLGVRLLLVFALVGVMFAGTWSIFQAA